MNVSRLIVLGTLADHGPMYGHQIRRLLETVKLEAWSEVRPGSLYNALHRLESEDLIRELRTERSGRLPARTVYEITDEGQLELALLRDRGLRQVTFATDPFDVALWVSSSLPREELEAIVQERIDTLQAVLASTVRERERLLEHGYLPAAGQVLFRHSEARVEAELRWHEELLTRLATLAEDRVTTPSGTLPPGTPDEDDRQGRR